MEVGVKRAAVPETSLAPASYSVRAETPVRLSNHRFCSESTKTNALLGWCCNAQYEICIRDTNAINLCRTKFDNPYSNISEASALSLQSAFFATSTTSSKTASSPISQKTTSSATTTLSQTTTLPQTTAGMKSPFSMATKFL